MLKSDRPYRTFWPWCSKVIDPIAHSGPGAQKLSTLSHILALGLKSCRPYRTIWPWGSKCADPIADRPSTKLWSCWGCSGLLWGIWRCSGLIWGCWDCCEAALGLLLWSCSKAAEAALRLLWGFHSKYIMTKAFEGLHRRIWSETSPRTYSAISLPSRCFIDALSLRDSWLRKEYLTPDS